MYNIIKSVIVSGQFELTDILKKIDIQWISGKITEEQKNELIQLAQGHAAPQNTVDVIKKLAELEQRMKLAEDKLKELENTGEELPDTPDVDTGEDLPTESDTYPEYVVGKWYYAGDKCSENGKNYTCVAPEGQVCVWSPSQYPAYWAED